MEPLYDIINNNINLRLINLKLSLIHFVLGPIVIKIKKGIKKGINSLL